MKSTVIIVPCNTYEPETVYEAMKAGLSALGGISAFVSPEENILVKPNFLYPSEADRTVTTHPAVIRAALRLLREAGCGKVFVGDSPANGSCETAFKKLLLSKDDLCGARVAPMDKEVAVDFPEGRFCRRFHFTADVSEADAIIGLCKMKTHMLERVTGAVKNMYGLICGKRKAAGHVAYSTAVKFAGMLTDIHRATPQRLHIMDGIVAMEGNGPASGSPVPMGLILMSADPVALDATFCRLIRLAPEFVPTNTQGSLAGLGVYHEEQIALKLVRPASGGEATVSDIDTAELVRRFGKSDFDVQRGSEGSNILKLWDRLTGGRRRPVIDADKCVRCGVCVDHCPVEGRAVNFTQGKDKPPVYDYRKCIRCYCCQELCPRHAIKVK